MLHWAVHVMNRQVIRCSVSHEEHASDFQSLNCYSDNTLQCNLWLQRKRVHVTLITIYYVDNNYGFMSRYYAKCWESKYTRAVRILLTVDWVNTLSYTQLIGIFHVGNLIGSDDSTGRKIGIAPLIFLNLNKNQLYQVFTCSNFPCHI